MPSAVLLALLLAVAAPTREPGTTSNADPNLTPEWARLWTLSVWTTDDGLPQNTINDLVQTADGVVWIATFGGLARFDGHEFDVFDLASRPELPDNRVLALLEDDRGDLWVGFQFAGVYRMRDHEVHEVLDGRTGVVWDIAQASDGSIWVAAANGLYRIARDGSWRQITEARDAGAATATLAVDGAMWVSHARRGIERFGLDGRPVWSPTGPTPPATRLHVDPAGTVWAAAGPHVLRFDGDGFRTETTRGSPAATVFTGPRGDVWAGGEGFLSVGLHAPGEATPAGDGPFQSGDEIDVKAGLLDREGTVWVGTVAHGLLHLRPKPLTSYGEADGLPAAPRSVVSDGGDGVWVGTCSGLVHVADTAVSVRPGPAADPCLTQAAVDAEGSLWLAGPRDAVVRLSDGAWSRVPTADSVEILWGQRGLVFALSARSLSYWSGRAWTAVFDSLPTPSSPYTSRPLVSGVQDLWIGTAEGVLRWDGHQRRMYTHRNGLARGRVRALHEDASGGMWVGTYGGGLSYVTEGVIRTFTVADGLAENVVSSIVADGAGNLWLNGNRTLTRLDASQVEAAARGLRTTLEAMSFDGSDGFTEGNGPYVVRNADDRLWFPTIDGVVSVRPSEVVLNAAPASVRLRRILVDGRPLPTGSTRVPPATHTLEVDLSVPRFLRPQNLHLRYRLGNRAWIDAGERHSALFTDPHPGPADLEVEVHNLESDARHLLSVPLFVAPTLVETLWFRVLGALSLAAVLVLAMRIRERSLRRTATILRQEVDARQAAEREREAMADRLLHAQKLEAVGRLTGGIAHDFNNLLAVVLGHVELAADEVSDPEVQEDLLTARKAAERGAELTRQLLAFARRARLEPTVTDLGALTTAVERLLLPAVGQDIQVRTDLEAELWPVRVDAAQLETALLNLAFNARDAMPRGGTLTLEVRNVAIPRDASTRAMVGDEPEAGEYVLVTVRDTGEGIPPETMENVLDPFFSTKEVGKGTGLGLSMAYGFARQMGGYLTIDSRIGEGTEIRLYVPRDLEESSLAEPPDDVPRGSNELVLVVEDDDGVRRVAARYLAALGYRTVDAPSIAQCMRLLERHPEVALILSDIVLPGESGIDLRNEMRRRRPDLPVILMSGHGNPRGDKSVRDDLEDIFPKPFTREALGRRVAGALRARRRGALS
jgi:signal transduction histidine kinase/ligand-binding sensor domain-containing protein